ncbi:hypothetical protein [Sphingomicrobium sediminis]|uniref:YbjN domain-containing protein n=1 Tax=Sphingomicrobium sediminis TaxID=2950949 RepID=A0A9X2J2F7_9SPHN|nr:hypothetical protein [Sphingomicrobium sediminis]MCM8557754.1 hypothetical protein [Sphingomicrobium sediminis]
MVFRMAAAAAALALLPASAQAQQNEIDLENVITSFDRAFIERLTAFYNGTIVREDGEHEYQIYFNGDPTSIYYRLYGCDEGRETTGCIGMHLQIQDTLVPGADAGEFIESINEWNYDARVGAISLNDRDIRYSTYFVADYGISEGSIVVEMQAFMSNWNSILNPE